MSLSWAVQSVLLVSNFHLCQSKRRVFFVICRKQVLEIRAKTSRREVFVEQQYDYVLFLMCVFSFMRQSTFVVFYVAQANICLDSSSIIFRLCQCQCDEEKVVCIVVCVDYKLALSLRRKLTVSDDTSADLFRF